MERVEAIVKQSKQLSALSPTLADNLAAIRQNYSEAIESLEDQMNRQEHEGDTIDSIEERMSQLHQLARKHKVQPETLGAVLEKYQQEKETLQTLEQKIATLASTLAQQEETLHQQATTLSQLRTAAATTLSQSASSYFPSLGLQQATLAITLDPGERALHHHGYDSVSYLVQFNKGYQAQALEQVASGGELSRVALALYLGNSNENSAVSSLIFDEIDSGIGGATAASLGELLTTVATKHQVIVITHLATIAACANAHIIVSKSEEQGKTTLSAHPVSDQARVEEISRMLSGSTHGLASQENAKALLERTQHSKIQSP